VERKKKPGSKYSHRAKYDRTRNTISKDTKKFNNNAVSTSAMKCLLRLNTQGSIADVLGITHPTIMNICDNVKKGQMSDFYNSFKPLLYNKNQKPRCKPGLSACKKKK